MGESPTRRPLQPEATGAGMEVTKCLKPSDKRSFADDVASNAAAAPAIGETGNFSGVIAVTL